MQGVASSIPLALNGTSLNAVDGVTETATATAWVPKRENHIMPCGALGKIGNCQVAVSSALIADGRTWPLAFDLYVPVSWTDDAPRRAAAGIPATLQFREKWRIALAQVRAIL